MSQCLYAYNNTNYDDVVGSEWQAAQVSTISIMNFSGRIFIGKFCSHPFHPCTLIAVYLGLISDFTKNKYGMPRSYCLILVAVMFFISQVVTGSINDIAYLWIASALVGLAYGSVFSLFPIICLEWFGMRKCGLLHSSQILSAILSAHFSENLGYLSLSPIAGNVFSLIFGRNLDAHKSSQDHDNLLNPPSIHVYSVPQCLLGLNCYLDAIYLTMLATFLAILLSIWTGYRDTMKIEKSRKTTLAGRSEVIWQDEEGNDDNL